MVRCDLFDVDALIDEAQVEHRNVFILRRIIKVQLMANN